MPGFRVLGGIPSGTPTISAVKVLKHFRCTWADENLDLWILSIMVLMYVFLRTSKNFEDSHLNFSSKVTTTMVKNAFLWLAIT